mgnify:CR=1 FL=1
MGSINEFHSLMVNFEQNINSYVNITNVSSSELDDNVKSIRAWVDKQIEAGDKAKEIKVIEGAGKVLKESIAAIDDLKKKKYMEGSLKIVKAVTALVGGPYGALAGAVCGMLTSVFSASSPLENDLGTQLSNIVRDELKTFRQKERADDLNGLQHRVTLINIVLKNIKEKAKREPWWWMSGESRNPCKELKIPDENLFYSDFPQFIGRQSETLEEGLNLESSEAEVKNCITALVSYCKAVTLYMVLLANVLTTFEVTGHETSNIIQFLEMQRNDARSKLKIMVDDGIPKQRRRLAMFYHLRKNAIAYDVVRCFRDNFGMTSIPELEVARRYAEVAANEMPEDISIGYPKPELKDEGHHFQLINHTKYPIKITCTSDRIVYNNLTFKKVVLARDSFELPIMKEISILENLANFALGSPRQRLISKSINFGSACGKFTICLDGDVSRKEMCRVFEFAFSNSPFSSKINVMDKSTDIAEASGRECSKQMAGDKPPPIFFAVGKSHYAVYAKINGYKSYCKTWCFVVQEYDPSIWSNSLMKRLQRDLP